MFECDFDLFLLLFFVLQNFFSFVVVEKELYDSLVL